MEETTNFKDHLLPLKGTGLGWNAWDSILMLGLMVVLLIVGYHLVETQDVSDQIHLLPVLVEVPYIIDLFLGFIRIP